MQQELQEIRAELNMMIDSLKLELSKNIEAVNNRLNNIKSDLKTNTKAQIIQSVIQHKCHNNRYAKGKQLTFAAEGQNFRK